MIPKILHQIWWQGEEALPQKESLWRQSWLKKHPDWTSFFWDAGRMENFVRQNEPEVYTRYIKWPEPIMRANAFRYIVLKHMGGVYVDMDIECLHPIDNKLVDTDMLVSKTTGYNMCILGTISDNLIFSRLVKCLPDYVDSADKFLAQAGPGYFSLLLKEFDVENNSRCRIEPGWVFEPNAPVFDKMGRIIFPGIRRDTVAIHHEQLSWMPSNRRLFSKFTKHCIMPFYARYLNMKLGDGVQDTLS